MKHPEHLAPLPDWREEITLVPYSGTQMLDFGFRLDALELRSARFIERVVGGTETAEEWALVPLTGDAEADAGAEAAAAGTAPRDWEAMLCTIVYHGVLRHTAGALRVSARDQTSKMTLGAKSECQVEKDYI